MPWFDWEHYSITPWNRIRHQNTGYWKKINTRLLARRLVIPDDDNDSVKFIADGKCIFILRWVWIVPFKNDLSRGTKNHLWLSLWCKSLIQITFWMSSDLNSWIQRKISLKYLQFYLDLQKKWLSYHNVQWNA